MATPAVHRVWRNDRFYTGASLAIIIAVFVGFAPTYYLKGYFHAAPLPPLVHLRSRVPGWILLFLTQTSLVAATDRPPPPARRRRRVWWPARRRLGLTTAIVSARRNVARPLGGAGLPGDALR
jgi:hypothetical protein